MKRNLTKLTKEQKQLLFSAICELLHSKKPVKLRCRQDIVENGRRTDRYNVATLCGLIVKKDGVFVDVTDSKTMAAASYPLEDVRPFLRPYSSMIGDEEDQLMSASDFAHVADDDIPYGEYKPVHVIQVFPCVRRLHAINWFVDHRIDCWGLIKENLAVEAPKGMYRYMGYVIK